MRSVGPGSQNSRKSKQKTQQENGQYQSHNKGYSFFKPSTWYSRKSSANSPSSTSRGVISPGPSVNSLPARNVSIHKQAPDSPPGKKNAGTRKGSKENTGNWIPAIGWFRGNGGRGHGPDDRLSENNKAPLGRQDIVLTDMTIRVAQWHSSNSNTTDGLEAHQPTSNSNDFQGLSSWSKAESRDNAYTPPQTNRSLDHPVQPPTHSHQGGNPAGQWHMVGQKKASALDGGGTGRPRPNANLGQPPSTAPVPKSSGNTNRGVHDRMHLTQGDTNLLGNQGLPPSSTANGNIVTSDHFKRRPTAGTNVGNGLTRGQPQAAGAATGERDVDVARFMGFEQDAQRRAQPDAQPDGRSTAKKNAAEYPAPLGIQVPGAGPNGPNGPNLQRKQTDLRPVREVILPSLGLPGLSQRIC